MNKPTSTLLCLLFGHKWNRKVTWHEMEDNGKLWRVEEIQQFRHCSRCGLANPEIAANSAE